MILYKDEDNMVIMNIYPYNRGHLEVVPRKHYNDLNELNPDELKNFFLLVQKTITLIREVIKPDGINLGFNLGEAAVPVWNIYIYTWYPALHLKVDSWKQ